MISWAGEPPAKADALAAAAAPAEGRYLAVMDALRAGATVAELYEATRIDPWFLDHFAALNEIAGELFITPSTVKAHLASLMRKLAARNRVEVAMWAHETGRMRGRG